MALEADGYTGNPITTGYLYRSINYCFFWHTSYYNHLPFYVNCNHKEETKSKFCTKNALQYLKKKKTTKKQPSPYCKCIHFATI